MSAAIDAVQRFAAIDPAAPALTGTGVRLSFAELAEQIALRAKRFRASGARVLALAADNAPDWVVTDLAARAAGLAVVPVPQFFSRSQKLHLLADSGADLVIASERDVRELAIDLEPARNPALGVPGFPAWQSVRNVAAKTLPAGTAKISYTSGTTGTPKGVCITAAAIDAVADSLVQATGSLGLRRHLCLLPLATLLENIAGNDAPLIAGGEVIVPGLAEIGWSGAAGLDLTRLTRALSILAPDSIILVPEMLRGLLGAIGQGWEPPAALRFVAVGGGRVSPSLLESAKQCGLPVYEGYGLTECASVVALNTPEARRRGSVGRPLPHASVHIDGDGEIHVSGSSIGTYLGAATGAVAAHATGDIGHFDADGYLYIHGRSRNVFINSFGRNVSPDWIEPEFGRQGVIRQIAIFGEARPWNVAVIVAAPDAGPASIEAAIAATNAGLPDYARVADHIAGDEPFTVANGLLTGNGRVRRDAVYAAYRNRIEARYDAAQTRRAAG